MRKYSENHTESERKSCTPISICVRYAARAHYRESFFVETFRLLGSEMYKNSVSARCMCVCADALDLHAKVA